MYIYVYLNIQHTTRCSIIFVIAFYFYSSSIVCSKLITKPASWGIFAPKITHTIEHLFYISCNIIFIWFNSISLYSKHHQQGTTRKLNVQRRKDERVFFFHLSLLEPEPEFQDFFVFLLRYGCSFLNFPEHITHVHLLCCLI